MAEAQKNAFRNSTAPAQVPVLYEISSRNDGYSVESSAFIDQRSHIKFSQFSGDFGALKSDFCLTYESVMIHTSSGAIYRDDLKGHRTGYRGITNHGSNHGWNWSCRGEVAFSQFHISHSLLADVHRSVFDKDPDLAFLPVFTGIQNAEFAKLFDVMIARFQTPLSMSKMETDAWAVIFAETLIKEAPGFANQNDVRPREALSTADLNLISDWVAEHIGQSITVSELADLTSFSGYDFARRFQATVGMSPYQYVLNQRIKRAGELLETSSDSIAQIAFTVGFSSQAHMTDSFRQRLGTTPGAYRKSLS